MGKTKYEEIEEFPESLDNVKIVFMPVQGFSFCYCLITSILYKDLNNSLWKYINSINKQIQPNNDGNSFSELKIQKVTLSGDSDMYLLVPLEPLIYVLISICQTTMDSEELKIPDIDSSEQISFFFEEINDNISLDLKNADKKNESMFSAFLISDYNDNCPNLLIYQILPELFRFLGSSTQIIINTQENDKSKKPINTIQFYSEKPESSSNELSICRHKDELDYSYSLCLKNQKPDLNNFLINGNNNNDEYFFSGKQNDIEECFSLDFGNNNNNVLKNINIENFQTIKNDLQRKFASSEIYQQMKNLDYNDFRDNSNISLELMSFIMGNWLFVLRAKDEDEDIDDPSQSKANYFRDFLNDFAKIMDKMCCLFHQKYFELKKPDDNSKKKILSESNSDWKIDSLNILGRMAFEDHDQIPFLENLTLLLFIKSNRLQYPSDKSKDKDEIYFVPRMFLKNCTDENCIEKYFSAPKSEIGKDKIKKYVKAKSGANNREYSDYDIVRNFINCFGQFVLIFDIQELKDDINGKIKFDEEAIKIITNK